MIYKCSSCGEKFIVIDDSNTCPTCYGQLIYCQDEIENENTRIIFENRVFANEAEVQENNDDNLRFQEEKQRKIEGEIKQKNELQKWAEENKKKRLEEERKRIEKYNEYIQQVSSINDMYEYHFEKIYDTSTGTTNINEIEKKVGDYAKEGWRLINIVSNELGVNSTSSGMSLGGIGMSQGTNSTIDEMVLIFERCVKRYPR